jgi:hypothetical protein
VIEDFDLEIFLLLFEFVVTIKKKSNQNKNFHQDFSQRTTTGNTRRRSLSMGG